jgi:plastocyanin
MVPDVSGAICTGKEEAKMFRTLVAIALVAGIASLAAVACGGSDDEDAAPPPPAADVQTTGAVRSGVTGVDENGVIQYSIYVIGGGGITGEKSAQYGAASFTYDVDEITFKVGDTVHFTAIPTADPKQSHTFSIQELGAITRMKFGNSGEVTVVFDKPGRFQYRCDIHTGEGENGIIIVQ